MTKTTNRSRSMRSGLLGVFVGFLVLLGIVTPSAHALNVEPDERHRVEGSRSEIVDQDALVVRFSADRPPGSVTLISTITLDEAWQINETDAIWLGGFVAEDDSFTPTLAVVWSELPGGWFPVWKIQLQGETNYELVTLTPQRGHTYSSLLSFDPRSGEGSLLIKDDTTKRPVYAGPIRAPGVVETRHVVAGVLGSAIRESGDATVSVDTVELYSTYVPVDAHIDVVAKDKPAFALRVFERGDEPHVRVRTTSASPPGELWITTQHHDTGGIHRLGPIRMSEEELLIPMSSLTLPGETTLTWEYYRDGHRWLYDSFPLSIGWVSVAFSDVDHVASPEDGTASIKMHLTSDGPLDQLPLAVTASLRLIQRSDETKRLQSLEYPPITLFEDDVAMSAGEVTVVPLSIPIASTTGRALWQIRLDVQSSASITVHPTRSQRILVTPTYTLGGSRLSDAPSDKTSSTAILSPEEEEALRREAAQRPRRIIFNNDGDDARVTTSTPTVEALLQNRTTPLLGSQVDTIAYDTTAGSFGYFSRWSEVGEIFLTKEDIFRNNLTEDLLLQETDPLYVMIDFAREHGLEIFWAMRMNDTHDASTTPMLAQLKQDHPELIFGSPSNRPPYGAWSGVDYGHPTVRELAFRYVEEVAEHYDVDGILLDFFRHPVLFKKVAWGQTLDQADLDSLTQLMERIRNRLRELGQARGRPFLLAVRVPDTVEYARAIGIDLEAWLAQGLIDLLIPGGYFRLDRWESSIDLGKQYGVQVYPSFDESRVGSTNNPDRARHTLEAYRGRAATAWSAGASGIHLFNMFHASHPMLKEIGSPQTLVGKKKVYFVSVRGDFGSANPNRMVGGPTNYFKIPILTPDSPRALWPGESLEITMDVGEDVNAAIEQGLQPIATLRLIVSGDADATNVIARLNGHTLERVDASASHADYAMDPSWLYQGENQIELLVTTDEVGAASIATWSPPPSTRSALGITRLELTTPRPDALRVRVDAAASGEARVGSVLIRVPSDGSRPVPPGFDVEHAGYLNPRGWTYPGFAFNGPLDEEPASNAFAITLPMTGGEANEYVVDLYVTNRPAPGTYYDDHRLIRFRIDEEGRVHLPLVVYDVQLHVDYTQGNR